MQTRDEFVVAAILASLLCACLPRFPEGDLGGSESDGTGTDSGGTQGDETQGGGPCEPGEPTCTDGVLESCVDGHLEVTTCAELCAQNGQVSNGCSANACACGIPPVAGVWEGTTDAGHPLTFALSEDGLLLGLITIVDVDTGTCTGEAGLTARQTAAVEDGAFAVMADLLVANTPTSITGEFTSSDAARGQIAGYSGGYALVCGDTLEISTGSVFEGTGWSAVPCPDCSMACMFEDDGECDEPEGTGLCFDGTDVVDCG
jgi:hypothetical protein